MNERRASALNAHSEAVMGLGATEILLICFLALILFGGGKLADIGKGLGEGIKNFKQGLREGDDADKNAALAKGDSKDEKKALDAKDSKS